MAGQPLRFPCRQGPTGAKCRRCACFARLDISRIGRVRFVRVGRSELDDTTNRRSTTPRSGHLPIQPGWLRILELLRANVNADQIAAPGVAVLLKLRRETLDIAVAREASAFGMSPAPLSASYAPPVTAEIGLLLGVTTTPGKNLAQTCDRLFEVIRRIDGRLETAPNKMLLRQRHSMNQAPTARGRLW